MSSLPPSAKDDASNAIATPRRSPLTFFLLVFALSVP